MTFASLERAVLAELKSVAKNNKIRLKDIMEWSTGEIKPQEGETYYFLPNLNVHCCVKLPAKKAAEHPLHSDGGTLPSKEAESTPENLSDQAAGSQPPLVS